MYNIWKVFRMKCTIKYKTLGFYISLRGQPHPWSCRLMVIFSFLMILVVSRVCLRRIFSTPWKFAIWTYTFVAFTIHTPEFNVFTECKSKSLQISIEKWKPDRTPDGCWMFQDSSPIPKVKVGQLYLNSRSVYGGFEKSRVSLFVFAICLET